MVKFVNLFVTYNDHSVDGCDCFWMLCPVDTIKRVYSYLDEGGMLKTKILFNDSLDVLYSTYDFYRIAQELMSPSK